MQSASGTHELVWNLVQHLLVEGVAIFLADVEVGPELRLYDDWLRKVLRTAHNNSALQTLCCEAVSVFSNDMEE